MQQRSNRNKRRKQKNVGLDNNRKKQRLYKNIKAKVYLKSILLKCRLNFTNQYKNANQN